MKIVIALGGNALLQRGEPLEAEVQRANVARAAAAIAPLAHAHTLVVTHGNAPQVGLLALQSESYRAVTPYPLDILGAQSEGMIGYLIERELQSLLPKRQIVTLLTQIEVNPADPAFKNPSKPIGPAFSHEDAQRLGKERGWAMAPDGPKWRRVVPSPEPIRVRELPAIRLLMSAGAIVVCAGGGGIPVMLSPTGAIHGAEAVIDKDLAAALLAHQLGADALLLLTDVVAVHRDWGTPRQQPIHEVMPDQLRTMHFAPDSMKPKVEAACRFVEAGGKIAGIGRLEDAAAILEGVRGTIVRPSGVSLDFTPPDKRGEPSARPAPSRVAATPAAAPPVAHAQQAVKAAASPAPPADPHWVPFDLARASPKPSAPPAHPPPPAAKPSSPATAPAKK